MVIGAIYMVFASGTKDGRHNKSGEAVAVQQQQENNPRGDVRSSGSGND